MRRNPTTEIDEVTQTENITSLLSEAFEKGVEVGQCLSGLTDERVDVVENPSFTIKKVNSTDYHVFVGNKYAGYVTNVLSMGRKLYVGHPAQGSSSGNANFTTPRQAAGFVANAYTSALRNPNGRKRNSIFLTPAVMQQLGRSGVGQVLTKANPTWRVVKDGSRWYAYGPNGYVSQPFSHKDDAKNYVNARLREAKRNPESSAAEVYAEFHGKPSEQLTEFIYEEHEHENLAQLGELISLTVITTTGYDATIQAPPLDGPVTDVVQLCSTEDKRQLYLIGGDQSIDIEALGFKGTAIKDLMVIGTLEQIEYCTEKSFHKFKPVDYYHQLGEETGVTPILLYDPISKLMRIAGGEYFIEDRGIVN